MFWNRKTQIRDTTLGLVCATPIPPKKHFETMLAILRDAEKYDNAGEKEVSDMMLRNLCDFASKVVDQKV